MSLTGDVWMRVLDSLLAFDADPASSVEVLTHNGILLRRAVRERVRGLEAHIPAIIREIDDLDEAGESSAATALWLDLKLMIERKTEASDMENSRDGSPKE